jgi:hypothetical protein
MLRQGKGGREPRFPVSHSVFSEPALASLLGLLGEPAVAGCECGLAGAWEMAVRRTRQTVARPGARGRPGKGPSRMQAHGSDASSPRGEMASLPALLASPCLP